MSEDKIILVNIEDEMKGAYIDYSMSVIVSRALPDVRDGLKPVHRRVLYGMQDLGVFSNRPYKKSARIVGEVLGKYHPHGDSSVYDTMVRMAQHWSLRYPLVDGQGNYGSVDGDPPAAMRYTEARMTKMAEEMLSDIEKDTVDFRPNFDDSLTEPVVLPTRIPNLLVNGASGIAVGMATNMAPHNLTEIIDATIAYIDNRDIDVAGLMKYVKAPDFPTAGIIYGFEGVKEAFETGRGRIVMRAKHEVEEHKGRERIIALLKPNEDKFRNLQDRLKREQAFTKQADITSGILTFIVSNSPSDFTIAKLTISQNIVRVEGDVSSPNSITSFIEALKSYKGVSSVSIDKIQNKPSSAIITVTISAVTK